jgi:hypothetical protein
MAEPLNLPDADLVQRALPGLASAALDRWSRAGLNRSRLEELLSGVSFVVADLPTSYLGLVVGDTVYIDENADGRGWYLDDRPWDDEEFSICWELTTMYLPSTVTTTICCLPPYKSVNVDCHPQRMLTR